MVEEEPGPPSASMPPPPGEAPQPAATPDPHPLLLAAIVSGILGILLVWMPILAFAAGALALVLAGVAGREGNEVMRITAFILGGAAILFSVMAVMLLSSFSGSSFVAGSGPSEEPEGGSGGSGGGDPGTGGGGGGSGGSGGDPGGGGGGGGGSGGEVDAPAAWWLPLAAVAAVAWRRR